MTTWYPAEPIKPAAHLSQVLLCMADGKYITGHYAPNGKWIGFAGNQSPPHFEIGEGMVKYWSPIDPAPGILDKQPVRFKGGNLTLNSGGVGPDEYLFRILPHGKWTRIILRHGPRDRMQYKADWIGLVYLIQNSERVDKGTNARRWRAGKDSIDTLPAATYAAIHGGPPEPEYPLVLDDSLVDAEAMAREHPTTFAKPTIDSLRILRPGDRVKIGRNGERFCVKVADIHGRWLEGTVANDLFFNPDLPLGRLVCFEWRHVYDVLREEAS